MVVIQEERISIFLVMGKLAELGASQFDATYGVGTLVAPSTPTNKFMPDELP